MVRSKLNQSVIVIIILLLTINLWSDEKEKVVLAKYIGGEITKIDIQSRIDKIPPMYQSKYQTNDGKIELLDMMAVEEIFYQEALDRKLNESESFWNRIDLSIKSQYSREYQNDLSNTITYTEKEKKAYYHAHKDEFFKDRTYEETEKEIEQRLFPEKTTALLDSTKAELFAGYQIEIDYELLNKLNLEKPEMNQELSDQLLMNSSVESLRKTVAGFLAIFKFLPEEQKVKSIDLEERKKLFDNTLKIGIFYQKALDEGYDQRDIIIENVKQIKKNMMLRTVYNQMVVEEINLSDDDVLKYYEDNIEQFSTNAFRKIQTFVFENEETAEEMKKKVKKFLKKKDYDSISQLIAEKSLNPNKNGEIDHIYQNGIIPGIGKDELYNDMVWEKAPGKTNPKKLNNVFMNSKGEFVFFRILEDNIAEPKPFIENIGNVKKTMDKELSKKKFEDVKKALSEKYDLQKYPERLLEILSAEEYFNKAEESQKKHRFHDAVFYYNQVIKYHQNNQDDYKALFMKAFLYAEELKDMVKAVDLFEEVLNNYPHSDLHESAQFMIDEIQGKSKIMEQFEKEEHKIDPEVKSNE